MMVESDEHTKRIKKLELKIIEQDAKIEQVSKICAVNTVLLNEILKGTQDAEVSKDEDQQRTSISESKIPHEDRGENLEPDRK